MNSSKIKEARRLRAEAEREMADSVKTKKMSKARRERVMDNIFEAYLLVINS